MPGAAIALSFFLTMAAPQPEELISKLGAARYADRESAAIALEKLGRSAIPALKAGRSNRDNEIRSRAETLLLKIQGSLLLEPTLIRLDFQDRPLVDLLADINRQSGVSIILPIDVASAVASRRISLQTAEPVPFWTAVDRICNVSSLQYSFAPRTNGTLQDTSFKLSPGELRPPGPMSDHGPFRINLMSLHYKRELTFGTNSEVGMGPGQRPQVVLANASEAHASHEQFSLQLQVAAEPQLSIVGGQAKVVVATDDLGQSMLLPATGTIPQIMGGYGGMPAGPVQFNLFLKRPEKPGRTIRLLRGSIPLTVSTRKPESLEISLATATGKTVQNGDASITIHDMKANPSVHQTTIELTIVQKAPRLTLNPGEMDMGMGMPPVDISPMNLELVDAQGKLISWYLSGSNQNNDEVRWMITATNPNPQVAMRTPTTLRYYGTIRSVAEIPFEFRNVPMP